MSGDNIIQIKFWKFSLPTYTLPNKYVISSMEVKLFNELQVETMNFRNAKYTKLILDNYVVISSKLSERFYKYL